MAITNWYLKIDRLPEIPEESITYLDGLKPHKATDWERTSKEMNSYKEILISQLVEIQDNRCAYCGLSLAWNLVDREHFVHKGQNTGYPEFMFNVKNLFAACGYCNRRIKGQRSTMLQYNVNYDDCTFLIIHPYFDDPDTDLEFLPNSSGQHILASAKTGKGQATIDFFELSNKNLTIRRAGFIAERQAQSEMEGNDYAELKAISYYKPS